LKLYEIDSAIEALVDPDTGELLDFEEFERMQMERDKKIEGVLRWYKNEIAEANAIKAEAAALTERAQAKQKKAEGIKGYLQYATAGTPFKCAVGEISYRSSQAVVISEDVELPDEYMRIKREPDKKALAEILKQGTFIPGVELVSRTNMTIK